MKLSPPAPVTRLYRAQSSTWSPDDCSDAETKKVWHWGHIIVADAK
jgi:hypothetical protein